MTRAAGATNETAPNEGDASYPDVGANRFDYRVGRLLERHVAFHKKEVFERRQRVSGMVTASTRCDEAQVTGPATSLTADDSGPRESMGVIHIPVVERRRPESYYAVQEWEGRVTEIGPTTFRALLNDKTDTNQQDMIVELNLDELDESERAVLAPAAVFRWTIGFKRLSGGTRERVTRIVFRQMPRWTASDIASADAAGKARADALRWD